MRYLTASLLLIGFLLLLKAAFKTIYADFGRDSALLFASFGTIAFIAVAALIDYQRRKDREDREIYSDLSQRPLDGEVLDPLTRERDR